MPTRYPPQLVDTAMSWPEIWNWMFERLHPDARQILAMLGFYLKRDLIVPEGDIPLTEEEEAEFNPIVSALTFAATASHAMRAGVVIAALMKVAENPAFVPLDELHPVVQWEIARDYQRGEERPGTFLMDVWGTEQTSVSYTFGQPTDERLAAAAARAATRLKATGSAGRPSHRAHPILVELLVPIFRASGQSIVRHREKQVWRERGRERVVYVETGAFHNFLILVLPPLQEYLREHRLPPVTIDSIVRLAIEGPL